MNSLPNMANYGYHCWITNVTKSKLVLWDLKWTIDPGKTVDLLDYRGSRLSVADVETSIEKGSLGMLFSHKMIKVRHGKPQKIDFKKIEVESLSFPNKVRTMIKIESQRFKELEFDSAELNKLNDNEIDDHAPAINMQESLGEYNSEDSSDFSTNNEE